MEAYFLCYFNKNQAWNTNYRDLDLSSRFLSKRSDCYKHISKLTLIFPQYLLHQLFVQLQKYQTFYFNLKLDLSNR